MKKKQTKNKQKKSHLGGIKMTRNEMKRKLAEMVIKAKKVEELELVQKKMEMLGFTDLMFEDNEITPNTETPSATDNATDSATPSATPWEKEGMSRSAWYRNKKEQETDTVETGDTEVGTDTGTTDVGTTTGTNVGTNVGLAWDCGGTTTGTTSGTDTGTNVGITTGTTVGTTGTNVGTTGTNVGTTGTTVGTTGTTVGTTGTDVGQVLGLNENNEETNTGTTDVGTTSGTDVGTTVETEVKTEVVNEKEKVQGETEMKITIDGKELSKEDMEHLERVPLLDDENKPLTWEKLITTMAYKTELELKMVIAKMGRKPDNYTILQDANGAWYTDGTIKQGRIFKRGA